MYIEAYFLDKLTYGKSISYVFSQTLEACYLSKVPLPLTHFCLDIIYT